MYAIRDSENTEKLKELQEEMKEAEKIPTPEKIPRPEKIPTPEKIPRPQKVPTHHPFVFEKSELQREDFVEDTRIILSDIETGILNLADSFKQEGDHKTADIIWKIARNVELKKAALVSQSNLDGYRLKDYEKGHLYVDKTTGSIIRYDTFQLEDSRVQGLKLVNKVEWFSQSVLHISRLREATAEEEALFYEACQWREIFDREIYDVQIGDTILDIESNNREKVVDVDLVVEGLKNGMFKMIEAHDIDDKPCGWVFPPLYPRLYDDTYFLPRYDLNTDTSVLYVSKGGSVLADDEYSEFDF